MMRALWTAASGMNGQQYKIDITANNLANVNTTGFKKAGSTFKICCIRLCGMPVLQ